MSWAVAMTARARPSRRDGAPEDPAAPVAPVLGLVISGVPEITAPSVSGDVADKIISLVLKRAEPSP
jgi:hypothetical protein